MHPSRVGPGSLLTALFGLSCLLPSAQPARALAQDSNAPARELLPVRVRALLSGGVVVSDDQHAFFDLDLPVITSAVRIGLVPHELVVLDIGVGGGAFLSSAQEPGGLLDVLAGVEIGGDLEVGRAWASVHAGVGITGSLARARLSLALGLDISATPEESLGPAIEYGHLFEEDGENRSDDAAWLTIGLTGSFRAFEPPPRAPPPPAPPAPTAPAPPPPPLASVDPVSEEALLEMLDEAAGLEPRELLVPVLFGFDSTEIISCSAGSLRALRDHLEEHPEIEVLEIEGHADGSGSDAYNLDLATRRAEAIRDWLIAHEIDATRLRIRSRGEAAPVETNGDEAGREQNRRVRFRVAVER